VTNVLGLAKFSFQYLKKVILTMLGLQNAKNVLSPGGLVEPRVDTKRPSYSKIWPLAFKIFARSLISVPSSWAIIIK